MPTSYARSLRLVTAPSTNSMKESGRIGRHLRGFSGVAFSGAAPKRAVTVKILWFARSSSIVRAPGAVATVCTTENFRGLSS